MPYPTDNVEFRLKTSNYYKFGKEMLNYKQLYQANNFDLPEIIRPQLKPFPDHQIFPHPDPNRDASIAKLFKDP